MITLCKCERCQTLLIDDNPQNPYTLRYKKVPKGIEKAYHGGCPKCLTDEFIQEITTEEILTGKNKKEVEELAEKYHPGYLYLMPTSRGVSTKKSFNNLKNYIFVR